MSQPNDPINPLEHLIEVGQCVDSIVLDQAITLGRQRLAEAALEFTLSPDVEGAAHLHRLATALDILISAVALCEEEIPY